MFLAVWERPEPRARARAQASLSRMFSVAPAQLVGEQVEVRYTTNTVEVCHRGKRAASHRRRYEQQPSAVAEHMPSAHRAHAEWPPSRLIRWAEKVGPATDRLVACILENRPRPEQRYRLCLGIMQLVRHAADVAFDLDVVVDV